MGEYGECHTCGYSAKSEEEVRIWKLWGCCRMERMEVEYGIQARTCRQLPDGSWIAPADEPEIQNPDALKEGILDMIAHNKAVDKKRREEFLKKTKKDGNIK